MFEFRIINTPDGNQVIDRTLKTPYSSLSPMQMLEYTEMYNSMCHMDRLEAKRKSKRKKRIKKEKIEKIVITICAILLAWILLSYLNVVFHNMQIGYEYPIWNLFTYL